MRDPAVMAIGGGVAFLVAFAVCRSRHPVRLQAGTTGPLRGRDIVEHARQWSDRDARWAAERLEWERRLDAHLLDCRRRWVASGWQPPPEDRLLRLVYTEPGVARG